MLVDPARAVRRSVAACLREAGFRPGIQKAAGGRWTREVDGAVQHVRLTFDPSGSVARRTGTRVRWRVQLGVVHPVVNMAFVRATPETPRWPEDLHVRVDLGRLGEPRRDRTFGADDLDDVLELLVGPAASWLEEHRDPRRALESGADVDPFVALEIAAVVGDRELGEAAADRARDAAAATERGDLRLAREKRWRTALDRLHQR